MHWWVREYPVTDAAEEAKVTETTAFQVYQYLRDIFSWWLLTVPMILPSCLVVLV